MSEEEEEVPWKLCWNFIDLLPSFFSLFFIFFYSFLAFHLNFSILQLQLTIIFTIQSMLSLCAVLCCVCGLKNWRSLFLNRVALIIISFWSCAAFYDVCLQIITQQHLPFPCLKQLNYVHLTDCKLLLSLSMFGPFINLE